MKMILKIFQTVLYLFVFVSVGYVQDFGIDKMYSGKMEGLVVKQMLDQNLQSTKKNITNESVLLSQKQIEQRKEKIHFLLLFFMITIASVFALNWILKIKEARESLLEENERKKRRNKSK